MKNTKTNTISFFRSQRFTFLSLFMVLALVPVILLSLMAYWQAKVNLELITDQSVDQKSRVQHLRIHEWIDDLEILAILLAKDDEIVSMDPEEATNSILIFTETHQNFESVILVAPSGRVVAADKESVLSTNIADREYFQKAMQGETNFSDVLISHQTSNPIVVLATPVIEAGEVKGVLALLTPMTEITQLLQEMWTGETTDAYLINKDGLLITRPRFADALKEAGMFEDRPELEVKIESEGVQAVLAGKEGTSHYRDYRGEPVIGGYYIVQSTNWFLLIEVTETEVLSSVSSLRTIIVTLILGIIVLVSLLSFWVSRALSLPILSIAAGAQNLARGENVDDVSLEPIAQRQDELGLAGRAFQELVVYLREMGAAAENIATGDLNVEVQPRGPQDMFGKAFSQMISTLRDLINQVKENADKVSWASEQLASVANQSGQATGQVASTIQQVATGITQQSQEVSRTSSSVEQINRAIHAVAKGAQKQAQAVQKTSTMAAQISSAIQQATGNAQSGAQEAREAADAAGSGARMIEATIAGMQTIKTKVGLSAQKVREMGQRSEQIHEIVETIDDIASQTNLLALNAAIEAARVEAQGEKTVESILQQHLLGVASLVAELLAAGRELHSKDLEELARRAQVEQFSISDADGIIVAASNPRSLGFRFSEDPSHQSSVFRPLLNRREGVVVQPIRARDQNGKPFVFVGVSRRDRPGLVQAGIAGDAVYRLGGYSRGFAVVADEIRKLAEHAKSSTEEIALLIRTIQKTVREAVEAMENGVRDVESRSAQATEAGKSLATIIETVEAVNRQVGKIAAAVEHMNMSSMELVGAMEVVSSVVEQNIAATEEMAAQSSEMTQAVENIASVSEENSAAVEEVGASAEEISAQVEEVNDAAKSLAEMAQALQELVGQFTVNATSAQPALQM